VDGYRKHERALGGILTYLDRSPSSSQSKQDLILALEMMKERLLSKNSIDHDQLQSIIAPTGSLQETAIGDRRGDDFLQ